MRKFFLYTKIYLGALFVFMCLIGGMCAINAVMTTGLTISSMIKPTVACLVLSSWVVVVRFLSDLADGSY
jgi:hypothetical protein